jgi:phage replication O-like protein O
MLLILIKYEIHPAFFIGINMSNPQIENGYVKIANELYDALNCFSFPSASPLKLMHIVIRKTYGYNKKQDCISISQFQKMSKLSRPTIVYWLDWLVKSLLLVKGVQLLNKGYIYAINKDFDKWKALVKPLLLVKARAFSSKPPITSGSKPPLTHKRQKTINKRQGIFLDNLLFYQLWSEYKEMRNKIRKPMTDKAEDIALSKLEKYDIDTAMKMLEQSIFNSWQGIFPIKDISTKDPIEEDARTMAKEHPDNGSFPFGRKYGEEVLIKYKRFFPELN